MFARVISFKQETWYSNVLEVYTRDGYMHLRLDGQPYLVHFWLGSGQVSFLFAERPEDVTAMLREEQAIMPRHDYQCPKCGELLKDFVLPSDKALYDLRPWPTCCGLAMDRLPSAPSFVIGGYNAKNGYSKEPK